MKDPHARRRGGWWVAGERAAEPSGAALALNAILVLAALGVGLGLAFRSSIYDWNWDLLRPYAQLFANGWLTTIVISVAALAFALILGVVVAMFRRSRVIVLQVIARAYLELVRGTPLLVQILVLYYVVAEAMGIDQWARVIGWDDRYLVGALALAAFSGAYISEIVRAGIESVGASQWESARAVGFTVPQTYRFIVFPQAIRSILPPLAGEFVNLVKNSSLLQVIAVTEFTFSAQQVASNTYSKLEAYLLLVPGYLLLTLPISLLARYLERKTKYDT